MCRVNPALAVVFVLLACDGGPAGEGRNESWPHAVALPDCAPWDGAATSVTLSNEPPGEAPPVPSLRLAAWRSPDQARGHRFAIGEGGPDGGTATFCEAASDCTSASEGWIEFTPGGGALVGSYDLTFPDGTHRSGRFRAPLGERQALCG
jgi:hypothetical protein